MKFVAKADASSRTKNRIREHGPEFQVKQVSSSVSSLNDIEGLLLQGDDGWLGWLPAHEIRRESD